MHVAHLNTARARAPFDDAAMAGFVERIAHVNSTADTAPGFVWRLDGDHDDGGVPEVLLGDALLLVNISVWTDLRSLGAWVYGDAAHLDVMRRREEWFVPTGASGPGAVSTVCWWVPEGHRPTIAEAEQMLVRLRVHGPSDAVFPLLPPQER